MSLLNLKEYCKDDIMSLLDLAFEFKKGKQVDYLQKRVICNLFFEPSTRTHYSFEMAAIRLGCKTINFNPDTSSICKNETMYDTVRFFESIEPDLLVIRDRSDNYYTQFKNMKIPIVNGGDGKLSHPTQSLLDLMTIYENFNKISNLKILIIGDIKHSRVAHTNIEILKKLGNEVFLSSPKEFQQSDLFFVDIDDVIEKMDVVMVLRVQFERHEDLSFNPKNFLEEFGLSDARVKKLKSDAIIMHPAPFNEGVEISRGAIECDKSKIFEQMKNGLYLRMAVLHSELQKSIT
ncbi:MAG: aspartate carbamoyltransferase catalytic subunit [Anaerorhabdus sp.]